MFQLDVKNTFLYGDLQEEVDIRQPPDYAAQRVTKVYRLKKAAQRVTNVYRLKKAAQRVTKVYRLKKATSK